VIEPAFTKMAARLGTAPPGRAELDRRELAIRKVERGYGLSLPDDFRLYLLHASQLDQAWDDELVIWWPIERLRNVPEEYEHPVAEQRVASSAAEWLFFADFSLWAWAWAICCGKSEDRGRIALIGGSPDRIVADSFTEFVDRHLSDPDSLC
jgi:hypothetical protein